MWGLECRVCGLGFGVGGVGCGVWGFGFGVWGLGCAVWRLECGVWCFGFGVWVLGLGFIPIPQDVPIVACCVHNLRAPGSANTVWPAIGVRMDEDCGPCLHVRGFIADLQSKNDWKRTFTP